MADIATLGIRVTLTGERQALSALDGLTSAGARTERQTDGVTRAMRSLAAVFSVYKAAQWAQETIRLADAYTNLHARLGLVTSGTENLATIQRHLFDISQDTRSSVEANVGLYTSLARSTKDLGVSQQQLLDITRTVGESFLVSGASASETANAVRQLGQALASGVLRGDEFNSIAENAPRLQQAVAESLHVTIGQLRAMAEQGQITSQVIVNALLGSMQQIHEEAQRIPTGVGGAFTKLRNAVLDYVGTVDQANSISHRIAETMTGLAKHFRDAVAVVGGAAIGIGAAAAAWQLYTLWASRAVVQTAILGSIETIQAFIQLAKMVRSAADAMALLSIVGKGAAGAAAAIIGIVAGYAAYRKLTSEMAEQTDKFNNSLHVTGTTVTLTSKQLAQLRKEEEDRKRAIVDLNASNADRVRVAQQGYVLAGLEGTAAAKQRVEFDALNDTIAAQVELQKALVGATDEEKAAAQAQYDATVRSIQRAKEWNLAAVDSAAILERQTKAADRLRESLQRLGDDITRSLSDAFAGIVRKGIDSFRDFFAEIRDMVLRLVADLAAAKIMQKVGGVILGALTPAVAAAQTGGSAASPVGAVGAWGQGIMAGAAGAIAGAGVGYGTQSAGLGAISGAISAFTLGAGPVGIAVSALAGLAGGILGAGHAAREAAKQQEQLRIAFKNSMAQFDAMVSGDTLEQQKAQVHAQADALRQQAAASAGAFVEYMASQGGELGAKFGAPLTAALAHITDQENKYIAQLEAEAAVKAQQAIEDLRVRTLRNEGHQREADLLAKQLADQREYAAAEKAGMDRAYLDQLKWNQSIEENAVATGKAADAIKGLTDGLNMVAGYKDTLQRTIFAMMPAGGTIGMGPVTPRSPGSSFTPTSRDSSPSIPSGDSRPIEVVVNLDGREVARSVVSRGAKGANAKGYSSVEWYKGFSGVGGNYGV